MYLLHLVEGGRGAHTHGGRTGGPRPRHSTRRRLGAVRCTQLHALSSPRDPPPQSPVQSVRQSASTLPLDPTFRVPCVAGHARRARVVRRTLLRGIAVAACATGCCAGASPTTARSMANALRCQRTIAAWGGSAWCWIEMDDGTYRVRHSLIRIAPAPIAHAARRHTSRAALACIAVQPPVKRRVHTARRSTSGRVRRPALLSIRRAIAVAPTQRLRHHRTQSLEWRHPEVDGNRR